MHAEPLGERKRRFFQPCGFNQPVGLDIQDLDAEAPAIRFRQPTHLVQDGSENDQPSDMPSHEFKNRQVGVAVVDEHI